MSGGIAYVYDKANDFKFKCNRDMVELEKVNQEDAAFINNLLINHYRYTKSSVAKKILDDFNNEIKKIIKVMPKEYKRILESKQIEEKSELGEVSDG